MEPASSLEEQPRFELLNEHVKNESAANSPHLLATDSVPLPRKPSPNPLPSTETADIPDSSTTMPSQTQTKKKGTASAIKKAPKRQKAPGEGPRTKKPKTAPAAGDASSAAASSDEGSDHGPYCLCRGPDDHRWMICCEKCEDWFHGECINLDKTIGESLIEKFVCPNCSRGDQVTIYKKTCALGACRKAARLTQTPASVFCSDDHTHMWWERMVGRLPKGKARAGLSDQLVQEEFMALLGSGLATVDGEGAWKLVKAPFTEELPGGLEGDNKDDPLSQVLSDEEKTYLDNAAQARFQLAEETLLCHRMLSLVEFAQERRRAAINNGRFDETICGYDSRLDTISARDAFAAFVKTPEGEAIFAASKLDAPAPEARAMCDRKRCKVHAGWQKMMAMGIKYQVREMASQAAEVAEDERIVREAAGERWKRKRAEKNWVEVLDG